MVVDHHRLVLREQHVERIGGKRVRVQTRVGKNEEVSNINDANTEVGGKSA